MQKLQTTNERPFKWEIRIGSEVIELSDKGYTQLMEKEKEGVRLVKIGDRVINPAFISSAKKVYQVPDLFNTPDWVSKPVIDVSHEQKTKIDQMKQSIRDMLKRKHEYFNSTYRLNQREVNVETNNHIEETYQMLIGEVNSLFFPDERGSGWYPNNAITHHSSGKDRHPVEAQIKKINLKLHEYQSLFDCEARLVICSICQKTLEKSIYLFNNNTGNCYRRVLT